MSLIDRLLILPQFLLPQRLLSTVVNRLTRIENRVLTPLAIKAFCAAYEVDLSEALIPARGYASFNQFFTRALRPDARPIAASPGAVVCPADGAISQLGTIDGGTLLQAKGQHFKASELLGGEETLAAGLENGRYVIVYLSPRDYHRVHAPFDCSVRSVTFVPGRLFSVNDRSSRLIERLYARNERLVLTCDSEWGECAIVMVGAMLVSSMTVSCCEADELQSAAGEIVRRCLAAPVTYRRGEELGRFNMGSTAIVLLPSGAPDWLPGLGHGSSVRMGQTLATPLPGQVRQGR